MAATVVLQHRTPDGREHFDWLLQRPCGGPLITFRLEERPDHPGAWPRSATRLADHREAYLTFEGALSGGRGEVSRVAQGDCEVRVDDANHLLARVRLGAASGELSGHSVGNSMWRLELQPLGPAGR